MTEIPKKLDRLAWRVLLINALYYGADGLCSVFTGAYFYLQSQRIETFFLYLLTLYGTVPLFFVAGGWLAKVFDRAHIFRAGLLLHAIYYAVLLLLGNRAGDWAIPLGGLLGLTWGFFWAGNHTFLFDASAPGVRDRYFGWLTAITGVAAMLAPIATGMLIPLMPTVQTGYFVAFSASMILFAMAWMLSLGIPADSGRQPFQLWNALFPRRTQRDWRLILLSSFSLAGAFSIFQYMIALLIYLENRSELQVGGFAAIQALIGVLVAWWLGHALTEQRRGRALFWGTVLTVLGGACLLIETNVHTLLLFGVFRSIAQPLFSIPYAGIRVDVITRSVANTAERIEYLAAWEIPLALGRVLFMGIMLIAVQNWGEHGVRWVLFLMCCNRILTYALVMNTSIMRR